MDFTKLTKKKFKKKYADDYMSKKDQKAAYYAMLAGELPEVLKLLTMYSNVDEVKEIKGVCYERIANPKFIKYLSKVVSKDPEEIKNIEYMPIIILDMIKLADAQSKAEKEEDPNDKSSFDLGSLVSLSKLINKKKIKKMEKAGIPSDLAFDVLSILPTNKLLGQHQMYRLKQLMQVLYAYAKTVDIDFGNIMKYTVNTEYYPAIITYLLLERKNEFVDLDDKQKAFFNKVTEWCLNTMNDLEKEEIREIFKAYFNTRKRDKAQNKDSNRRYFLSSIPVDEFPEVVKVLNKMKDADSTIEEFM